MDEQQVRALVRQAIARHLGPDAGPAAPAAAGAAAPRPPIAPVGAPGAADGAGGLSYARFHLMRPAGEVECLIEPAVACTHCGYCQCYGH